MSAIHRAASALFIIFFALPAVATQAQTITTASLAREMIDTRRLADFPDPAFRTVQFSSYDRRANLPGGPGWFANADGFGGEPIPNFEGIVTEPGEDGVGEYLICDVRGPGAIVRCWTAAIAGSIRMYLDGASEPIYDGSADDFLRRPFNVFASEAGVDPAFLDGTFNQRNATYCPIPFAKRCRIIWIGKIPDIHFYEVQMRLYEPGADVVTFRPGDLATYENDLKEVAAVLGAPSRHWRYASPLHEPLPIDADVPAGEMADLLKIEKGPGALERITMRVEAADLDLALRQTILHIFCDDYPHGQVQSPIGDFFGAAPGINPFDSVPFTVKDDGAMTCRFVMPYETSIRIAVENRSGQVVSITGEALPMPYEWDDARSMHFRARWRIDHDLIADPQAVKDLPFLLAHGKGRYVGTASIMLNPTDVPTPAGGWWGEGDEKIFIDDDARPSTFGTGSEDYYNYAWSTPDIWGYAYAGQPRNDGPGNRGFVTNHRWHIIDSLPFHERIAFYMELKSHKRTPGYSYARLAYHYALPGAIDDHVTITDEDVRPLELAPNWEPLAYWGAANSIFHEPETLLEGDMPSTVELREGNLYSRGRLFVWKPKRAGETISFIIPIAEAGTYSVDFCAVKSGSSGGFGAELEGHGPLFGSPNEPGVCDLNMPARTVLRRINTRRAELEQGEYRLTLKFDGPAGGEIGLDFIWIQKR